MTEDQKELGLPIKINLPEGFLDEEVRCDYLVSKQMKEVWAVELDLLCEFDRVCRKNNIKYYLSTGTLLGAVRHSGFIPWDDDIDVMMFRDDYEKLSRAADQFHEPYFFQTEYTDPGSTRGHAQLRNSNTTAIIPSEHRSRVKINQGIFIDVFVIDNYPDDEKEQEKLKSKIVAIQEILIKIRLYNATVEDNPMRTVRVLKTIAYPMIYIIRKVLHVEHALYIFYEKLMKKYHTVETSKLCMMNFLVTGNRVVWDRKVFDGPPTDMPFEGRRFPVPPGYEEVLTKLYGDWKKIVRAESSHGALLIDPRTPYSTYL